MVYGELLLLTERILMMKHTVYFFLTLFFAAYINLNAVIYEMPTIHCSDINQEVKTFVEHAQRPLIIFDLDNTIMEPFSEDERGSDQWFCAMLQATKQLCGNFKMAVEHIFPLYADLQQTLRVKPVEAETVQLIEELRENGITVIGLTARSFPLVNCTREQLRSIGVTFSHRELVFIPTAFADDLVSPAQFTNGIMFCGLNDKGCALKALLKVFTQQTVLSDETQTPYDSLIFIDDKKSSLLSVQEAAQELGIPFIGLRYGYLDEKVQAFRLNAYDVAYTQQVAHTAEPAACLA